MSTYIYQLPDWPRFRWNHEVMDPKLSAVRYRQGELIGKMKAMGFELRSEAVFETLTLDVLKSSAIEGEQLNQYQVRSSIARRLGMDIGALAPASRSIEGVVEMMLDATQHYDKPLTEERLFGWDASLFPTGYSGLRKIKAGAWRDDSAGPMQIVSGPVNRERVHYEAPPAEKIEEEMRGFLEWFNGQEHEDPVLRASIAHLWFVTLHPFEDGNGRIARTLADMLLARSEQSSQRFYSMSAQIHLERDAYYTCLKNAQKGTLDITPFLSWFIDCLDHAFSSVENTLVTVLKKARFWESHRRIAFNDRQRTVINRLFEGLEGKLTSSKWAKMVKTSQDTALRDIQELLGHGILVRDAAGGRSTSYSLVVDPSSGDSISSNLSEGSQQ
jgi:Fic family protein